MYAVPAAQCPSIAATIGTTPLIATCSRNSAPAPANVEPRRRLDARAGGVEQPDERHALADARARAAGAILFSPTAPIEPGHHREVVRGDRDRPAVDLADAGDRAVGGEVAVAEAGVHVVGEQPVLDPRAGVEQEVEAFADGELAELALALDALVAAHLERALLALREVADERSPVVDVAARRPSRLRHQRPFHCGARFSANAATPSAASSVCVVTVSMPWRYESAASASISSTR